MKTYHIISKRETTEPLVSTGRFNNELQARESKILLSMSNTEKSSYYQNVP
jgi:hypothetical protein